MKTYFISGLFVIISLSAICSNVQNSSVSEVTIYHSGATVKRILEIELKPGNNELEILNISSKILLNSIKFNEEGIHLISRKISRKLSEEEFQQLVDKKTSLLNQIEIIEKKFKQDGFVKNVNDLERLNSYYNNKLIALKEDFRRTTGEIEEAGKYKNYKLENENAGVLRLLINSGLSGKQKITIQYLVGGIGWSPYYEVNAGAGDLSKINLKYYAKIMSQTGENWNQVKVKLSSSQPLDKAAKLPYPTQKWILEKPKVFEENYNTYDSPRQDLAELEGVVYEEIELPGSLKTRELTEKQDIRSNSTVFTFKIDDFSLPSRYYHYAFPQLNSACYLIGEITNWQELGLLDGIAEVNYNENTVGKSELKFSQYADTLKLVIGQDNEIFVERKAITDKEYLKTSFGKTKAVTQAYQIAIKNNSNKPLNLQLFELSPISGNQEIKVDIEQKTGANILKEDGLFHWSIQLNPGKNTSKKVVYTIASDNFIYATQLRNKAFRVISCPSF